LEMRKNDTPRWAWKGGSQRRPELPALHEEKARRFHGYEGHQSKRKGSRRGMRDSFLLFDQGKKNLRGNKR